MEEKPTIIIRESAMNEKLTIIIEGDSEPGEEHRTTIRKPDGEKIHYYTDGYDGVSAQDVIKLLDFVGAEYFTVHKNTR